jgi:choline dehydrogenase
VTDDFDYIVVGAGSAGAVLAARLSQEPTVRVLLLEAGPPDRSFWIHLPIGYGKTMWSKTYNWCFETDPDPGMNGRRIYWPRGKTLGGSSSINGLIYIRGQREDYDHWARWATAAGATTTCCPTSSAAKPTSAAPTPGTAPTAR